MRSAPLERLLALAIGSALVAAPASAAPDPPPQGQAAPDDPAELREQVLMGQRSDAIRAAIELFLSGKPRYDGRHDIVLKEVLERRGDASAQARRCVLEALATFGRDRPLVACRLARIGLSDEDSSVRDGAASALEGIERREAYDFLRDALKELSHAPAGSPQARDLEAITGVLERKRDPIAATGAIVDALSVFDGPEEQRLDAALKRLTGRSFPTHDEWRRWYDEHKKVPQREWYLEVLRGLEDANDKAGAAAERIYEKLLAALAKDEVALLRELEDGLSREAPPSVRASAIRNLGVLGSRQGQTGDRAAVLLEEQLRQGASRGERDDRIVRAALGALGRTGRPGELSVILPHLENASRGVRLAAASALGALGAEGGVAPLVSAFEAGPPPCEVRDPETAAVLARAIGAVGRDPEGRASRALLVFAARILASPATTPRPPAPLSPLKGSEPLPGSSPRPDSPRGALLQAAAEALGSIGPALSPESETAGEVVAALDKLGDPAESQDVRWWAATSLGRVRHQKALFSLAARFRDEAVNVRRAAIGSIGLQARREGLAEDLLREAVAMLAGQLASPEDALKRAARTELELVVASDLVSFSPLVALTDALGKRGEPDLAAPFLDVLPAPDKLTEAQRKSLTRYWSLLEARARARLRLADGRGALADFELLLAGAPGAAPGGQRALSLGRARALLASGEARGACELSARLARTDPKDDEAWGCVRACAEALLAKGERGAAKELLASLEKPLGEASPDAQAPLREALRRAGEETPSPEPARKSENDEKRTSPHPGAGQ